MKLLFHFFLLLVLCSTAALQTCWANLCIDCSNIDNQCRTCMSNYSKQATILATTTNYCPCPDGFYYSEATNLCKYCNIICLACTNSTYCTKCVEGWDLLPNNTCAYSNQSSLALLDLTTQNLNDAQISNYIMMDVTLTGNLKNYVSKCDSLSENYFGMDYFNVDTNLTKSVYNMPPHDWIRVRIQFAAYDDWVNIGLVLTIDTDPNYNQSYLIQEKVVQSFTFDNTKLTKHFCKLQNYSDSIGLFDASFSHSSSMLKFRIGTTASGKGMNIEHLHWGVKNIFIITGECYFSCNKCTSLEKNSCLSCIPGYILTNDKRCICADLVNSINGICLPYCNQDQRGIAVDGICYKCSEFLFSCKRCANNSVCLKCEYGTYLSNGVCVRQCPISTYPEGFTQLCKPCQSPCQRCTQFGCTYCNATHNLVYEQNCLTECPLSTYQKVGLNTCQKCPENCLTCSSKFECTDCKQLGGLKLKLVNGGCVLPCQGNISTTNCPISCDSKCNTCLNSSSPLCVNCKSPYFLYNYQCKSVCPTNTYSELSVCKDCHYSCQTCKGPGNRDCLSCLSSEGFALSKGLCVKNCPWNQFLNNSACSPCPQFCRTCVSSTKCSSCLLGKVMNLQMCYQSCPSSTYLEPESSTCLSCAKGCLSCYRDFCYKCDPSTSYKYLDSNVCRDQCSINKFYNQKTKQCEWKNPTCGTYFSNETDTYCQTCNYFMPILISSNKQCEWECPAGYFINRTNQVCLKCAANCATCYGTQSGYCLSCFSGYYLRGQSCLSSCPARTVKTLNGFCLNCPAGCITCNAAGECYSCQTSLVLHNLQCLSSCVFTNAMNTYLNNSACVTCDCAVCINSTRCVKCKPSAPYLYPFNSNCLSTCPDQFYPDNNTMICQACSNLCRVCTSYLNCVQCMPSPLSNYIFKYKGVCYSLCPNGTYGDQSVEKCLPCSKNCLRCYGPQPKQCVSCQPGFIMNLNQCVERCPPYKFLDGLSQCEKCYPLCQKCYGPASFQCLSCSQDWYLYDNSCHMTCPEGTFKGIDQDGHPICSRCQEGCKTCTTGNPCQSCKPSYVSYLNKCLPSCPQGTYLNQSSSTCDPCIANCRQCNSNGDCLACNSPKILIDNTCQAVACPPKSYLDNNRCQPCTGGCYNCSSETSCMSCQIGYIPVGDKCLLKCPAGYYKDNNNCVVCSGLNCATCLSSTQCISCKSPYVLTPDLKCSTSCPSGYYSLNQLCYQCSANCLQCTNSSTCKSCPSGYTLLNGKCYIPNPNCLYSNTNNCNQCPTNCYNCTSSNQCSQCSPPSYLTNNHVCVDICPVNYYPVGTECSQCHPYCLSCTGFSNNCTGCKYDMILFNGQCVNTCPSGFYFSSEGNTCYPCQQNCQTCFNKTTCLDCPKLNYNGLCVQTCPPGYFAQNLKCYPCTANCTTCLSESQCIECDSTSLNQYNFNGKCQQLCPINTYEEDRICKDCSAQCLTCYNSTYCSECRDGSYLTADKRCVSTCPVGTYLNIYRCSNCSMNCKVCNSSLECQACKDSYYLFNSNCYPTCPPSSVMIDSKCEICPKNCLDCSSPNNCTRCIEPYTAWGGQCVSGCPVSFYFSYSQVKCLPCNTSCFECLDGSSSSCVSCKDGYYFNNGTCRLNCPIGTYASSSKTCAPCPIGCQICLSPTSCSKCTDLSYTLTNGVCTNGVVCDVKCSKCYGTTPDQCTQCKTNYLLMGSSCVQNCPATYFSKEGLCYPCQSPCKTCISTTSCDSCITGYNYYQGKCYLICPSGTLSSQNNQCVPYDCSSLSNCNVCPSGKMLYQGVCYSNCPPTTRPQGIICLPCSSNCLSCNQSSCTSCTQDYYLYNGICYKSCPSGTFLSGLTCKQCEAYCATCSDSTTCQQCIPGGLIYREDCYINCPNGTTLSVTGTSCIVCPSNCITCTYDKKCKSCEANFYLNPVTQLCTQTCPSNYYVSVTTQSCIPCQSPCKTCSSNSTCQSCLDGYVLSGSSCIKCPTGSYLVDTRDSCANCASNCLTCSSPASCVSCNQGFFLSNGICVSTCPDGYYKYNSASCQKCPITCTKCNSSSTCTSCITGYVKDSYGNCIQNICPPGKYLLTNNNTCVQCSSICKTCYGPLPTQCATCQSPYVLYDGICIEKCPTNTFEAKGECFPCSAGCLMCSSLTSCDACASPLYLYNHICSITCPPGTYLQGSSCIPCSSSCGTCLTTPSNCQGCKDSLVLYDNRCYEKCPEQTYLSQGVCKPCSSNCQLCSNSGCTQCIPPTVLNTNTSQCSYSCPSQTYKLDNQCLPCSTACATCSSLNSCFICNSGFILWNGACWSTCPTGYKSVYQGTVMTCTPAQKCYLYYNSDCVEKCPTGYFNNSGICSTCANGCYQCSSSSKCSDCSPGFYLSQGICKGKCPQNTYADALFKMCLPCSTNCQTCQSSSSCLSCKSPYIYNDLSKTCDENCPNKYYNLNGACTSCLPQCLTCTNSTSCVQCLNRDSTPNTNCSTECPTGKYKTPSGCQSCSASCANCFQGDSFSCTSCPSGYILLGSKCVSSCPQGYYPSSNTCLPCKPQCVSCTASGSCSQCQTGYLYISGSCVQTCPEGSYKKTETNCSSCATNCSICSSTTQCYSCKPNFYLYQGSCFGNCPTNTILNLAQECVSCSPPCKTCSGEASKCTSCIDPYVLVDNICYQSNPCPAGTIFNGTTCVTCSNQCMKCKINGDCQLCISPYYLSNNVCVATCPKGTSYNQYTYTCSSCNGCQQCVFTSSTTPSCTKCPINSILQNGVCVLNCSTGNYNSDGKCVPCNLVGCATCSSPTQCANCSTGYTLKNNICMIKCPDNSFQLDSTKCQECSTLFPNCQQCTSLSCSKCVSPAILFNQQCVNSCPAGYAQVSTQCKQCGSGCTTCDNLTSCNTCQENMIADGKGGCVAPAGCKTTQYFSTTTGHCQSCDTSCLTCSGSNYFQCTSCAQNLLLVNGQCQSKCPNGTYQTDDGTCQTCTPPCLNCISASQCTSCLPSYLLLDQTCIDNCPTGSYLLNGKCFKCSTGCVNCTSQTNCVQCSNGYFNYSGQCINTCPSGTYQSGTQCYSCDPKCKSCASSSTNCSQCIFGYYFSNNTCMTNCPQGTYGTLTNNILQCVNCSNPLCKSCLDSTQCSQCLTGYLYNGTCTQTCPGGTYIFSTQCKPCKTECKTCNSTQCTDCFSNFTLTDGSCKSDCGTGLFWNGTSCINCSKSFQNCSECLNSSTCIRCSDGFIISNNKCVKNCDNGTYYSSETSRCENCSKSCQVCNSTECAKCEDGYSLIDGVCLTGCPPKTVNVSGTCKNCSANCVVCNTALNCTSCQTGYLLSSGNCVETCPEGTYLSGLSCLNCSNNCKTCTNSTNCNECKQGYAFQNNTCVSNCNGATYMNETLAECKDCPSNCNKCVSDTNCSECKSNAFFYESNCYIVCPEATYGAEISELNKTCIPCGTDCLSCDGKKCSKCPEGYFIQGNACVTECSSLRYFNISTNSCEECPKWCSACEGPTNCTSCFSPYILEDGFCESPTCPRHCLQCPGKDEGCTLCNFPHLLLDGQCVEQCPKNYYAHFDQCLECMENCLLCPNSTFCDQCSNGYGYLNESVECAPAGFIEYGKLGNMSTFTSNITATISTIYLSTSAGPMVFGEMSSTYFNMEFTQMLYFHAKSAGDNPEVTKFLNSLSIMTFQLPFGGSNSNKEQNSTKRLLIEVQPDSISQTFLLANKSILILAAAFLGVYLTVLLMQKYMESCFAKCNKAKMYAVQVCEFLMNRFTWNYFDFIIWLSYLPFLFFSITQLKNISFKSADLVISSLISILIIIAYPLYPGFVFYLIRKRYAVLEIEGSDKMVEMSMAPFVYGIKRDKVNIMYYPAKYIRKLLFVIFAATIPNPEASLGCLIALNGLWIVLICVRRPHSMVILMILDLIVQGIMLFFQVFMLVYIKKSAQLVSVMSIITHGLGFLSANLSLVIAIILNLIAYYKIFRCIYDLVQHLRTKGTELQSTENIIQQDQKFARQMEEIENGDMGTEIGDNLPAELLQEKFNRLELNNQYGFDPSVNPNGDYLWDQKGLIGFSQSIIGSKPMIQHDQESEVQFMDIVREQDGATVDKKKKKGGIEETELGIRRKPKKQLKKEEKPKSQIKNLSATQQAQIKLMEKLGNVKKESKLPSITGLHQTNINDDDTQEYLHNKLGSVIKKDPKVNNDNKPRNRVPDEQEPDQVSVDVFKKKPRKNSTEQGEELSDLSLGVNRKRISRKKKEQPMNNNSSDFDDSRDSRNNGSTPLIPTKGSKIAHTISSEEKLKDKDEIESAEFIKNGYSPPNLPPLAPKKKSAWGFEPVAEFELANKKESSAKKNQNSGFFNEEIEEALNSNKGLQKNKSREKMEPKTTTPEHDVDEYQMNQKNHSSKIKENPPKQDTYENGDSSFELPEATGIAMQLKPLSKIKPHRQERDEIVDQAYVDPRKKLGKAKDYSSPSPNKRVEEQNVEEATLRSNWNNPRNNLFHSGGNRTIPQVREQSIDDFGVSGSKIRVPPQLPRMEITQDLWNEEPSPQKQQKLRKSESHKKNDRGFKYPQAEFEEEQDPARRYRQQDEVKQLHPMKEMLFDEFQDAEIPTRNQKKQELSKSGNINRAGRLSYKERQEEFNEQRNPGRNLRNKEPKSLTPPVGTRNYVEEEFVDERDPTRQKRKEIEKTLKASGSNKKAPLRANYEQEFILDEQSPVGREKKQESKKPLKLSGFREEEFEDQQTSRRALSRSNPTEILKMRAFINKNEREEEQNAGQLLKSLRDSKGFQGLRRTHLGIREDDPDFKQEESISSRVKKREQGESMPKGQKPTKSPLNIKEHQNSDQELEEVTL